MKKVLFGCVLFSAMAAGAPVMAADLPVVPAAVPFSWSGLYVGGNLGWISGRFSDPISTPPFASGATAFPADAVGFRVTDDSFTGGLQLGYRWQFQQWVLGLEGDVNWMDVSKSNTLVTRGLSGAIFVPGDSFSARQRWESTLRANVGYAWDRWLLYATGGIAFTDVRLGANFIPVGVFPGSISSSSKTLTGGTVGAGLAYAITNNLDIGLEYRYTSFGHHNFGLGAVAGATAPGGGFTFVPVNGRSDLQNHEVTVRINYKFDWRPF